MNLLVCLGSLSCCITQVHLSLSHKLTAGHSPSGFYERVQNSWFHQLCKVPQTLKLQSIPKPSHYHHHVWLLVWCSFYEILCWFYARCNGTHTFQKVKCLSHQSTEYLPKSLGNNQYICGKCETNPCVLGTLPVFFSLIVESWTLTFIEVSETCSSLDVVLCSFITTWMSPHCTLGVILVGRPLLGRFTNVPNVLHLWIMALTVVRWSPKALKMAL